MTAPLLALLAVAASAAVRGPYLVDASSVSARACWRDAAGTDACSDWDDLAPGADFRYSVPGREGSWTARTLPPAGRPLRFAVFGDTGSGSKAQKETARTLASWLPDLLLIAGDVVYPSGKDGRYDERFFAPYGELLSRRPVFPAPGNHDYGDASGREKALRRYAEGYGRVFRRPPFYSFDAGDAHFAVVDTSDAGAAQRAWLERDLGAAKARWTFVLMHAPLYSTGPHGGSGALRRSLEPVFERRGVDAVFQGHDHHYERTRPVGKTVHFVVGTGGARLRPVKTTAPWSAKTVVAHGFLAVTLEGPEAVFEFYDASGALRDLSRLRK
ncbi:MAG: metallophosphoesterase [Elusimicrobia bacterium]|nr:metallophosphoesterase [Elusimicrobiota bacterium]